MQVHEIFLSPEAMRDLRDIKAETLRASRSSKVAEDYLKRMRMRLRSLEQAARMPACFSLADDAAVRYRFCAVEHHVACFKVEEGRMVVVRILQGRSGFEQQASPSDDS